ncbi:acyl carrier protein [Streptomyces tsukubensis]|uniref:Methoxymalonate biosynthesis protein n=1 Tax=Streptomyces tsukubensis TaxID=83656 RepID=A0A1V4AA07_9ACTN|nr:acyl carrier protein [Streptomyces tsukubensis]OON80144.1 methoxymalonate biosynthesis protein [Streptomyces tsukubensis]QFR97373.1 acyl carrier protein [Streptomyces tsukubensis]
MTASPDRSAPQPADDPDAVRGELLAFVAKRTGRIWTADADVFGSGGLSSLFAMELVVHLEKTYDIAIRGADLRMDNFRTVTGMAALVARLRQSAPGGSGA